MCLEDYVSLDSTARMDSRYPVLLAPMSLEKEAKSARYVRLATSAHRAPCSPLYVLSSATVQRGQVK